MPLGVKPTRTPLAAAGLDRQPANQVLFSTLQPQAQTKKHFYSVPRGKAGLAEALSSTVQSPVLPAFCLSSFPVQDKVLSPRAEWRLCQATTPAPWDHTQCHERRLSQGPEHPNDKRGFIRSISKPVLSQLQHLNPEMSTCRAFTRSSNYADADLQE